MPSSHLRLESINRFKGALRTRIRCLDAALKRRMLVGSECKHLKDLSASYAQAEALLLSPEILDPTDPIETLLGRGNIVLIRTIAEFPQTLPCPLFHNPFMGLQIWHGNARAWAADLSFSALMQLAQHRTLAGAPAAQFGSHSQEIDLATDSLRSLIAPEWWLDANHLEAFEGSLKILQQGWSDFQAARIESNGLTISLSFQAWPKGPGASEVTMAFLRTLPIHGIEWHQSTLKPHFFKLILLIHPALGLVHMLNWGLFWREP